MIIGSLLISWLWTTFAKSPAGYSIENLPHRSGVETCDVGLSCRVGERVSRMKLRGRKTWFVDGKRKEQDLQTLTTSTSAELTEKTYNMIDKDHALHASMKRTEVNSNMLAYRGGNMESRGNGKVLQASKPPSNPPPSTKWTQTLLFALFYFIQTAPKAYLSMLPILFRQNSNEIALSLKTLATLSLVSLPDLFKPLAAIVFDQWTLFGGRSLIARRNVILILEVMLIAMVSTFAVLAARIGLQ